MELLELVVAALVASYLGCVVLAALWSGRVRYRGRIHTRAAEPKSYWLVVGWFGLLTLTGLAYTLIASPSGRVP